MVDVICDSSFLIQLCTKRIKNIDNLDVEIGQLKFVVPTTVKQELEKLCNIPSKKQKVLTTIEKIKKFPHVQLSGNFADDIILSYIKKEGGMVATMDKELKLKVKKLGGSVISISNDKIVLESSKI